MGIVFTLIGTQVSDAGLEHIAPLSSLTEATRLAYYDYYLVVRELELNRDNAAATMNSDRRRKRNTSPTS